MFLLLSLYTLLVCNTPATGPGVQKRNLWKREKLTIKGRGRALPQKQLRMELLHWPSGKESVLMTLCEPFKICHVITLWWFELQFYCVNILFLLFHS